MTFKKIKTTWIGIMTKVRAIYMPPLNTTIYTHYTWKCDFAFPSISFRDGDF